MKHFLIRWLITTLAVMVVSQLSFVGVKADSLATLIVTGLFLGVMNAVVRPLLVFLSLPVLLLTMGLFFFFINAFLLWLASVMISGFHVEGFGSAFFGSILISIVSWIFSAFFAPVIGGGQGGGSSRIRMVRIDPTTGGYARQEPEARRGPDGIKLVEGRVIEPDDEEKGGRS